MRLGSHQATIAWLAAEIAGMRSGAADHPNAPDTVVAGAAMVTGRGERPASCGPLVGALAGIAVTVVGVMVYSLANELL